MSDETFQQSQDGMNAVRRRVNADLEGWWATLPSKAPSVIAEEVRTFVPILVDTYGEVAAGVAADFYDELRAESPGARRAYRAALAPAVAASRVEKSVEWAARPVTATAAAGGELDDVALAATLGRLRQVTDELTVGQGKRTFHYAARRDPDRPRVARILGGDDPCAFCVMLAGRLAVYESVETAVGVTPDHYHGDCYCAPLVMWDGDSYPAGYSPDTYNAIYWSARAEVTGGDPRDALTAADTKAILAVIRKRGLGR